MSVDSNPPTSSSSPHATSGGLRRQREDDEYDTNGTNAAARTSAAAATTDPAAPPRGGGREISVREGSTRSSSAFSSGGGHNQQQQQIQQVFRASSSVGNNPSHRAGGGGGASIVASFAHSPYARGPGYGLHRESSSSELEQQHHHLTAAGDGVSEGNVEIPPPYRSANSYAPPGSATAVPPGSTTLGAAEHRRSSEDLDSRRSADCAALSYHAGTDASYLNSNSRRSARGHQLSSQVTAQQHHHYLPTSRRSHHQFHTMQQQFSPFLEPARNEYRGGVGDGAWNARDSSAVRADSTVPSESRGVYSTPTTSLGGHPYDVQRELAVLQSSFEELQRQYGQKCGEVIVLQNTVAVLRDQLQELESERQQSIAFPSAAGVEGHSTTQQQQQQQQQQQPYRGFSGMLPRATGVSMAGRLRQRCPSSDVSSGGDDGPQRPNEAERGRLGTSAALRAEATSNALAQRCRQHDSIGVATAAQEGLSLLNHETPPSLPPPGSGPKHVAYHAQPQPQPPLKSSISGAVLFCDLCQISVNSDTTLRAHLQGERHRKALHRAGATAAAASAGATAVSTSNESHVGETLSIATTETPIAVPDASTGAEGATI
jgi:hypothetical protein